MKISYVPGRELSYSRTRTFVHGLEQQGVDLRFYGMHCLSYWKRLAMVPFKFLFRKQRDEDIVLIGYFGQLLTIILKPFIRKPLVLDAYLSVYDSLVFDKKKFKPGSLGAKLAYWLDTKSCNIADKVFVDTDEHIDYFSRTFQIPKEKFSRILIGADDGLFKPQKEKPSKKFIVGFHGLFIPLQGVEYIVQAANLLKEEDIEFHLVGKGQTYEACVKLAREYTLPNVKFLGLKKPNEIPDFIAGLDIGLGIFGETEKTQRVIPNKAYEIIAMKKPLLTADTPAIRELFAHKKNAYLCKAKNPPSLAEGILALKKNSSLRKTLAEEGYKTYIAYCTPQRIGKEIVNVCKELISYTKSGN